ncbi:AI-2E family transporter [Algiphilus aromaticivorans]|uniref:AI-2E family transporter n=1 Tax=Algiphilus aromaticivorans TaxID=382454 RepID=UPI0005C1E00F|nr:AI-2E family transporter [Algiphilus aromaticivorans]
MKPIRDWFQRQFSNPQVISLVLVLLLFWVLVTFFTSTFMPVFAAVVVAYLLEGPTGRLARIMPRWSASLLIWTAFMALALTALFTLLPLLTRQITQLVTEVPTVLRALRDWMMTLPEDYPSIFSAEQLREFADGLNINFARVSDEILARSYMLGAGVTLAVVYGVLVPLMVLFLLKDKAAILGWMRGFLPADVSLLQRVWSDIDQQIANYVRGKVVEIGIVWAVTYVVFLMLGLNYAALLGFITGVSVLVPYVGATLVTLPVAAVAYTQFGIGPDFAWVLVAYGIIQMLDGNVLVPVIFAETNDLHPVAIIVAVLFFGTVYGFWGVFFAIPLATVVAAVLKAWPRAPREASTESLPAPAEEESP